MDVLRWPYTWGRRKLFTSALGRPEAAEHGRNVRFSTAAAHGLDRSPAQGKPPRQRATSHPALASHVHQGFNAGLRRRHQAAFSNEVFPRLPDQPRRRSRTHRREQSTRISKRTPPPSNAFPRHQVLPSESRRHHRFRSRPSLPWRSDLCCYLFPLVVVGHSNAHRFLRQTIRRFPPRRQDARPAAKRWSPSKSRRR